MKVDLVNNTGAHEALWIFAKIRATVELREDWVHAAERVIQAIASSLLRVVVLHISREQCLEEDGHTALVLSKVAEPNGERLSTLLVYPRTVYLTGEELGI